MNRGQIDLPPGFRFHPTDEELVKHYLIRKCASQQIFAPVIAEIDLYKFNPWQLPELAVCGEKEWYFFSPRDRKYPNGSRPNRAAGDGYWKATGADKSVGNPKPLGIKKALVFYAGKAPKGVKTNWIMHEYRLANVDRSAGKGTNLKLDDWVLCRIYNKKGKIEKHGPIETEVKKPSIAPPSGDSSDSSGLDHLTSSSWSPEFISEVRSEPKWDEFEKTLDFGFNYMDTLPDNLFDFPSRLQPPQDHYYYPFQHDTFMHLSNPF